MQERQPVTDILEHVTLDRGYPTEDITFDPDLNFLTYHNKVIAFGSIPQNFNVVHPPETIEDLPQGSRNFKSNPKGVGLRVANEPAALIAPIRNGRQAVVSALEISGIVQSQIHDERRPKGLSAHIGGYVRHLSLRAQAAIQGDERAIRRAEKPYGDSSAVRLSLPPSWLDEHKARRIQHALENPEMLMLRSRRYSVRKIGSVSLSSITSRG